MSTLSDFSKVEKLLTAHVQRYEAEFSSRRRLPHTKDWRPFRFATQDSILGLTVVRYQSKDNIIEVDVCVTDDPKAFVGWSGSRIMAIFLISEAYNNGSSMGIVFTSNFGHDSIPVPPKIVDMAGDFGVELNHADKGEITPKEARQLYLALTEFSPEAERKVMELSLQEKIAPERICYMVHHLTYTKEEMESILLGTEFPESILLGKVTPEEYLLYQDVILRTRDVLLGGMLDRKLKAKEVVQADGSVLDLEGNDRRIGIGFDPRYFAKVYTTEEDTPIPWTASYELVVPAGHRIVALLRARDYPDFEYYFKTDLEAAAAMVASYTDEIPTYCFVVYPRNVLDLEAEILEGYLKELDSAGVSVMICPETTSLLDRDVMQRLKVSEIMRHDIATTGGQKIVVKPNLFDYNVSDVTLIALPADLRLGTLSLLELVTQAVYDENELFQGVNKHNVRARYNLVNDRMQFLAHQVLMGDAFERISLRVGLLAQLSSIWKRSPDEAREARLLPGFWTAAQATEFVRYTQSLGERNGNLPKSLTFLTDFLNKTANGGTVIVAVQDKHSRQTHVVQSTEVIDLIPQFVKQYVPDQVNDFGNTPLEEVIEGHILSALEAASHGQHNGVNLGEVPHMVITNVLRKLVYTDPKKFKPHQHINIVYTDGSQGKPFPFFVLKERSTMVMAELRKLKPIKMGMISMRHPEMDSMIDQYWFRNIEVSQTGLSSAERDTLCYEITLRKLSEIRRLNMPIRMSFYQTGFEIPLIGFWRAVVEFLLEDAGKPPMLEIIPFFYKKEDRSKKIRRDQKDLYIRAERWN